jgi:hypothetical protein
VRSALLLPAIALSTSCGGAKSPSAEPLTQTRIELTLDDGTKPPALDGRAFAVPIEGDLTIYVFDAKAPDPTCTDVNVGGWMDKIGGGSAAQIQVGKFKGGTGKYSIASIAHVHGGGGKGKVTLRSAQTKGAFIDLSRWDHVFEGKLGTFGTVSGIVCAAK